MVTLLYTEIRWQFCSYLVVSGDCVPFYYQENQTDIMFPGSPSEWNVLKELYCHLGYRDIIPSIMADFWM